MGFFLIPFLPEWGGAPPIPEEKELRSIYKANGIRNDVIHENGLFFLMKNTNKWIFFGSPSTCRYDCLCSFSNPKKCLLFCCWCLAFRHNRVSGKWKGTACTNQGYAWLIGAVYAWIAFPIPFCMCRPTFWTFAFVHANLAFWCFELLAKLAIMRDWDMSQPAKWPIDDFFRQFLFLKFWIVCKACIYRELKHVAACNLTYTPENGGSRFVVIKRTSKRVGKRVIPVDLGMVGEIINGKFVEKARQKNKSIDIKDYGEVSLCNKFGEDLFREL